MTMVFFHDPSSLHSLKILIAQNDLIAKLQYDCNTMQVNFNIAPHATALGSMTSRSHVRVGNWVQPSMADITSDTNEALPFAGVNSVDEEAASNSSSNTSPKTITPTTSVRTGCSC
ncbi:hypothetical protein DFH29DRAFT_882393 [Suillus ampliporus]|nr:hypothetical protein DFH29DRAFT_882393 [Suillus ampliporus]